MDLNLIFLRIIRAFEDSLSLLESIVLLQSVSSKLANLLIEEVGSYLFPSAAVIGTFNSCDAISKSQLNSRWANFSFIAYSCL
jgi:hypothetical protein